MNRHLNCCFYFIHLECTLIIPSNQNKLQQQRRQNRLKPLQSRFITTKKIHKLSLSIIHHYHHHPSSSPSSSPLSPSTVISNHHSKMTKAASSSSSVTADIDELQRKINEVRKQREAIGHENQSKSPHKKRIKSPDIKKKKKNKDTLYHPNLAYILGEIVHSPYMTSPLEKYPTRTFTIVEELRSLKREGKKYKDLPKDKRPYKIDDIKKTFVKEVVEFKPCYTTNVRQPSSREGSPNSRPTSSSSRSKLATGGHYKSGMLKAAEARGGPATYRRKLTEMKHKALEEQRQLLSSSFDPSLLNAFADEAIFGSKSSPNLVHFADDEMSLVASREKLLSRRQTGRSNSAAASFFQDQDNNNSNNNNNNNNNNVNNDDGDVEYEYDYDDNDGLGDFISIDVINNENGISESIEIDDMQGTIPEDGLNIYDEDNFEDDEIVEDNVNPSSNTNIESNTNIDSYTESDNNTKESSVIIDNTNDGTNVSNNTIIEASSTNESEVQYTNDLDSSIEEAPLDIIDTENKTFCISDNINISAQDNDIDDDIDDDNISVLTLNNIDNIESHKKDSNTADSELIKQISTQISSYIIDSEVQKYWAEKRKIAPRKSATSPERRKSVDFVDSILALKLKEVMVTHPE